MFQDNDLVTFYDVQAGDALIWNGSTTAPNVILASDPGTQPAWLALKVFDQNSNFQGYQFASFAAQQAGVAACYLDGATVTGAVLMNNQTASGTFWVPVFTDNSSPDGGTVALVCLGQQNGSRILCGNVGEQGGGIRLATDMNPDNYASTIWMYSRTKRGDLQLVNLNLPYNPNAQQLFQSCSFQLANNNPAPFPRDNQPSSWVSIDCYLTPSMTDPTQFISIGDMPCNVSTIAGNTASPTFNVTDSTFLWDLSRFVEMNPSIAQGLVGQSCYVYLQMRRSDGTILPSDGGFSPSFIYQGVQR